MDYFEKLKEKAKAYDEALEKAREYWETDNDNTLDIKAKGTMEYLFPELKESEGEKIRKDCIKYLDLEYQHCPLNEDKIKIEKAIAWLEKQGEQKPVIEMKTPEESLGISSSEYNKIVDECIYGDDESTWSEEDERTYKSVLYAFEHNYPLNSEQQKFIKSFKEKVQLKQEWSEGDEMYLTHVTNAVKRYFANPWRKDVIKWLKSLKVRYIWKPSKEQMATLLSEVNAWTKGCQKQIVLESLYNDLKKL